MAMPPPLPTDPVSDEYRSLAARGRAAADGARAAFARASGDAWSARMTPKKMPKDPSGSIAAREAVWIGLPLKACINCWKRAARRIWFEERIKQRLLNWLYRAGGWS